MLRSMRKKYGFTLIQLSIILTVASLIFVATLPGVQTSLKASAASVTKMNNILNTMRGYMAANGVLPCPADPTQAIGASNFGVAAANRGTTNNCIGGTPSAAYADSTNHIAIGMVPVKTLGLSYADAVDGYGRDITYAVDTSATGNANGGPCWPANSLAGAITVNDNGTNYNTVAVLVSHGQDGYGAWLPLSGASGTASRFDNGSNDTGQADNAQVAHGGGLTANTTIANFWRKTATATFDDSVVYKSNLYTLNTLPASVQQSTWPTVTPPVNGTYSTGQVLTFTVGYASAVTVNTANGTPRLTLSALSSGSIGTGSPANTAYATYQSGSGTTTLTFSYTVQSTDSAPNGLSMNGFIDLNGGTVSGGSTCFTAPNLSGVIIGTSGYYRTVTIDSTKVGTINGTDQSNFPVLFSGTYSYLATTGHGGQVVSSNGYDIYFSSDSAGHSILPFERESWNASTGAAVFWVQVPTVSHSTNTVFYLQYGNPNITTDQSNKTGTWDSNYMGVWHMDDNAANTIVADSTSVGNTGTSAANTNSKSVTGVIANGLTFNGSSDKIDTNNSGSMKGQAQVTLSAWVNTASTGNKEDIYFEPTSVAANKTRISIDINGGTHQFELIGRPHDSDTNTTTFVSPSIVPSTNTWYYIVGVFDSISGIHHFMINGTDYTNAVSVSAFDNTTPIHVPDIGDESDGAMWWNGKLDEVHISKTARSADWNSTEYHNQSAPDKATYGASGFYTVG